MTVIAMTREMGTRGKLVAALLAERLAARLVYHELVDDPPDRADMTGPSDVKRHLGGGSGAGAPPYGAARRNGLMTPAEILETANRGNVIMRGWGAVRILHTIPHVLCIRVCAPMEARIAEMTRRIGVSERTARREIERNDAAHTGVFRRLLGGDWRTSLNYDLVLNTARLSPEDCADLVVDTVSRTAFRETEESRQALADRLAEARIASFLANDPALSAHARNVYISASGGTVTLYGAVSGHGRAAEIEKAVRAHAQCGKIDNAIRNVGYMEA